MSGPWILYGPLRASQAPLKIKQRWRGPFPVQDHGLASTKPSHGTGMPLGASGCPSLPILGLSGTRTSRRCQLAGKATAGGSGTAISKIIIRNEPQALAECLHCHASTAYPALGSLAWQRSGSHGPQITPTLVVSGHRSTAKGRPAGTPSGARAPAKPAWVTSVTPTDRE